MSAKHAPATSPTYPDPTIANCIQISRYRPTSGGKRKIQLQKLLYQLYLPGRELAGWFRVMECRKGNDQGFKWRLLQLPRRNLAASSASEMAILGLIWGDR